MSNQWEYRIWPRSGQAPEIFYYDQISYRIPDAFPKTHTHKLNSLKSLQRLPTLHIMDFSRPVDDDELAYPHRPSYSRNPSSTSNRSISSSTASTSYSTHIGLTAGKDASPRLKPTVLGSSPMSPATGMRSAVGAEWDEVDKMGYQYSLRVA